MLYMGNIDQLPNMNRMSYVEQMSSEEWNRFLFSRQFSECLRTQRKKLGITQEDLAKLSGVNRVTIAKLEKYQRLASIDVILKLLDVLNLEIRFVERSDIAGGQTCGEKNK